MTSDSPRESNGEPRPRTAARVVLILLFLAVGGWFIWKGSGDDPQARRKGPGGVVMSGATMGTHWMIKLPESQRPHLDGFKGLTAMNEELAKVNDEMSTYIDTSELSRFNRSQSTDWITVTPSIAGVAALAKEVWAASDGALDVTLGPLIDLWGFGARGSKHVPSAERLTRMRALVGQQHLEVRLAPPTLRKRFPGLRVDLSAVAKGHGVDRLATRLRALGVGSYFIDIGGEVRVSGSKDDGEPWTIGIERPRIEGRAVARFITLRDAAVATSGDYRNFFEKDGQRYTHVLDPTTGRPVNHRLASVTVIADDCATADAWATALLVLGPENGYKKAIERKLAAYFIIRRGEAFEERETPEFERRSRAP